MGERGERGDKGEKVSDNLTHVHKMTAFGKFFCVFFVQSCLKVRIMWVCLLLQGLPGHKGGKGIQGPKGYAVSSRVYLMRMLHYLCDRDTRESWARKVWQG